MTANGPSTQSLNYTHMYDMGDLRGSRPKPYINPGSILGFLENNSDFSIFFYIVKLSKLDGLFNDCQADATLFVPSDTHIRQKIQHIDNILLNMEEDTARSIVLFSTLNRRIDYNLLSQSPIKYIFTQNTTNKMLFETYNNITYLNKRNAQILKHDINLDNGMVHIIDNILIPDSDVNVGSYKQF
jgi:hypothetical protein